MHNTAFYTESFIQRRAEADKATVWDLEPGPSLSAAGVCL